ncbi:MAG: formylglycine-generating enzyme family protein [Alphaproteobacteria bacterium]|nr:formylglycine-generating enzyme family protein [Alphaproteobacteria bacterium]
MTSLELPELVVIPGGRFQMGSSDQETGHEDCEYPVHEVIITRAFGLGRYPVTFDQWDAFAEQTGAYRPHDEGWGRAARPVINVSWQDAKSYMAWLAKKTDRRYRLPTEAEWEYAARAGTSTAYSWGSEIGAGNSNCVTDEAAAGRRGTSPVGQFPSNAFGLYDMHGNVWEWVEDCWNEYYIGAPVDGSAWLSGDCSRRVLRGGSWLDVPRQVRSAARNRNGGDFRCNDYGFRIAVDL